MAKSKIEWTDRVWNPVTGCTPVSPGCQNCWAKSMAISIQRQERARAEKAAKEGKTIKPTGYPTEGDPFVVTYHEDRVVEPLRYKKPSKTFVCSMGDLFHEEVLRNIQTLIWGIMAGCHDQTFLVLTKRPERMSDFLNWVTKKDPTKALGWALHNAPINYPRAIDLNPFSWPLKNVWLGVTAENQEMADKRIPILLDTPAAVRFVSVEPMLGPVDLEVVPCGACNHQGNIVVSWNENGRCSRCDGRRFEWPDWVICGGESGYDARPAHPDWIRNLRDQCKENNVPYFFKQWGAWVACEQKEHGEDIILAPQVPIPVREIKEMRTMTPDGKLGDEIQMTPPVPEGQVIMAKVGKKNAGHELDGKEIMEWPTVK